MLPQGYGRQPESGWRGKNNRKQDGRKQETSFTPEKDWPRRQESNLYFTLRRHTFYPLNYGEVLQKRRLRETGYRQLCQIAHGAAHFVIRQRFKAGGGAFGGSLKVDIGKNVTVYHQKRLIA